MDSIFYVSSNVPICLFHELIDQFQEGFEEKCSKRKSFQKMPITGTGRTSLSRVKFVLRNCGRTYTMQDIHIYRIINYTTLKYSEIYNLAVVFLKFKFNRIRTWTDSYKNSNSFAIIRCCRSLLVEELLGLLSCDNSRNPAFE